MYLVEQKKKGRVSIDQAVRSAQTPLDTHP